MNIELMKIKKVKEVLIISKYLIKEEMINIFITTYFKKTKTTAYIKGYGIQKKLN